jgi:hypothetical protein
MKKLLLLLSIFVLTGSYIWEGPRYVPLLMDRSALETSVTLVPSSMPITQPGRIYLYNHWILLVEQYKGIHFIDNNDPANPVRKAFLRVPGCQNMSVGNGVLYVDNAVDLVGVRIDYTNLQARVLARSRMVLPEINNPEGYIPWDFNRANRPENTEIVGWINKAEL